MNSVCWNRENAADHILWKTIITTFFGLKNLISYLFTYCKINKFGSCLDIFKFRHLKKQGLECWEGQPTINMDEKYKDQHFSMAELLTVSPYNNTPRIQFLGLSVRQHLQFYSYTYRHGLINFIDTKVKCHQLKILTCKVKGLCGRCLSEFID